MSLVKWSPRSSFPVTFNSLLDNFFSGTNDIYKAVASGTSVPAVNVSENEDKYTVELAAPGKSKEDFDVDVSNGVITISSESEDRSEVSEKKFTRKEFSFSSFSRSFSLPDNVKTTGIVAKYKDGVLSVELPKVEPSVPEIKKVAVS